ncbi:MAG: acyl-CoA/acyl-ACP dehydrogenase [Deltaproteobacteria bacterium]|nr:acyl-CoA/acyl-ACP dehydrogenase [Deltaproteobacteria bacterium]MBN2846626.1 acyl-CoA/acyl-ACP dehydrogenase [Deltaproteobacteria bacterium]
MIRNSEVKSILNRFPKFGDFSIGLEYAPRLPKGIIKETKEIVAYVRKFNDEVVRPNALPLDRKTHEDPDYLPYDLMKKANDWGLYTMWIPKMFGGKGKNLPSASFAIEEMASACVGIANVVMVHYLGFSSLLTSFNMRVTNRIIKDVLEGEKNGGPCLIAFAITEPGAGTDVEDMELVDRGKVVCRAERVNGGYVINGRKVFISMGHVSEWTVFYAYTDLKKPSQAMIELVVRKGTRGFSLGRHEDKMGQRVCPASEIIFDDCFIPDDQVLIDSYSIKKFTGRSQEEVMMKHFDMLASSSKAGVCAMGVGVARGALEEALKFASETEVKGKLLINHEWAQCLLAEMYKNVVLGRLAYIEANNANSHRGIYEMLQMKPIFYYLKYMPKSFFKMLSPMLNMNMTTWAMSTMYLHMKKSEDVNLTSGTSSLAKVAGSDLGIRNCQLAMDLMGEAGLRHDQGVEKRLRDSKLLQIYEGSNQMNRVTLFKGLIAPFFSQARVFNEGREDGI